MWFIRSLIEPPASRELITDASADAASTCQHQTRLNWPTRIWLQIGQFHAYIAERFEDASVVLGSSCTWDLKALPLENSWKIINWKTTTWFKNDRRWIVVCRLRHLNFRRVGAGRSLPFSYSKYGIGHTSAESTRDVFKAKHLRGQGHQNLSSRCHWVLDRSSVTPSLDSTGVC